MSKARDRLRKLGKLPALFTLLDEEELCPSCKIRSKSEYPHPCPYNEEMGDIIIECNCCEDCEHDCLISV